VASAAKSSSTGGENETSDLDKAKVAEGEGGANVYRVAPVLQVMLVGPMLYFTLNFVYDAVVGALDGRIAKVVLSVLAFGLVSWYLHHVLTVTPREIVVYGDGTFDIRGVRRSRTFEASDVTSIRIRYGRPIKLVVAGMSFKLYFSNGADFVQDLLRLTPSVDVSGRAINARDPQRAERLRRQRWWRLIPLAITSIGAVGLGASYLYGHDDRRWFLLCIAGGLGQVLITVVDARHNR
jgi:hypothetical protein